MEGLREGAVNASNHAVARRTFLALATAAVAGLMRDACEAEEGKAEGERRKPALEEVQAAMRGIAKVTFDDFRKGVDIAGVVIAVPDDGKAWGTIVAGDRVWTLHAKRGLAKAFVRDGCVITEMSWDGEKREMTGELLTILRADGPLIPPRKKVSKKTHSFEKTAEFLFRLSNDDEDIVLSDAEGKETGVVLTLHPPEERKEEPEEEKQDE